MFHLLVKYDDKFNCGEKIICNLRKFIDKEISSIMFNTYFFTVFMVSSSIVHLQFP